MKECSGLLVYLTRSIGKYACGSCGASGMRSGTQRLYAVGSRGGTRSTLNAGADAARTDASSVGVVTAGTEALTSPSSEVGGAATLGRNR
jgi:hypothetical protein